MDEYRFLEMTENHIIDVLEIYNYYILNSTATFHMHPLSKEEIKHLLFFDNPKHRSFKIESNGKTCGYCILHGYSPREAYDGTAEVSVYLKPGFTGKGIGSLAVDFLEEWGKKQELHVLIAGICAENTASINLFKKKGFIQRSHFKETGYKFGRWLDVFHFEKII